MATILPFVVRPRASTTARAGEGDAAIVIFPGVRYEAPVGDCEGGGRDDRPTAENPRRKGKRKTR